MSRHQIRPFVKTARRGSTYRSPGGEWWIKRIGSAWYLYAVKQGRITAVGDKFSTLADAHAHYMAITK